MTPIVAHLISGQVLFTALPAMAVLIVWKENSTHRLLAVLASHST